MFEKNAEKKMRIRRADIFLAVGLGVLALILIGFSKMGRKEGDRLLISHDGEVIERLSLEEVTQSFAEVSENGQMQYGLLVYGEESVSCEWSVEMPRLPEGRSYNLLFVSNGMVRMEAADCPDQICVHHIPIMSGGESIICLPHKLVIEIQGGTEENGLDGMVKVESISKTVCDEGRHSHETDG